MGCRPAFAATQVNLFEGTCYLTPVLGAWLADAHWGRYKTILVFSGIYFVVRIYRRQSQSSLDPDMHAINSDTHLYARQPQLTEA